MKLYEHVGVKTVYAEQEADCYEQGVKFAWERQKCNFIIIDMRYSLWTSLISIMRCSFWTQIRYALNLWFQVHESILLHMGSFPHKYFPDDKLLQIYPLLYIVCSGLIYKKYSFTEVSETDSLKVLTHDPDPQKCFYNRLTKIELLLHKNCFWDRS